MNKAKQSKAKAPIQVNVADPLFDKAMKNVRATRKIALQFIKELKANKTDLKRLDEISAAANIFIACQVVNIESYKGQIENLQLEYYYLNLDETGSSNPYPK